MPAPILCMTGLYGAVYDFFGDNDQFEGVPLPLTGTNLSIEVAEEGSTTNGIEAKITPVIGEAVIERVFGEVAVVLDRLTQQLKVIRDDILWYHGWIPIYKLAVQASQDNLDQAIMLQHLPSNSFVLGQLVIFGNNTLKAAREPPVVNYFPYYPPYWVEVNEWAYDYIYQAYKDVWEILVDSRPK